MSGSTPRKPNDVDRYVGRQIRARRLAAGWCGLALATEVGVEFSQMSRYELGVTRISAGRLYAIAKALGVKPGDLFPE